MKIITKHDYNVIMACKKDDNMKSLCEYLMYYLSINEINDEIIYSQLYNVVFNISDQMTLKDIFHDELLKYYHNLTEYHGINSLRVIDLAKMLYYHLYFLDILKIDYNNDPAVTDIYGIKEGYKVIPFSAYNEYVGKDKLCQKKLHN